MGNLDTHQMITKVDDHDVPIGVVDRADLRTQPANFRVVHLLNFDREGRMLLQRIAPGNRSVGKWGSSAAGYVHDGEAYVQACLRTTAKELGVEILPRPIGKTTMKDLGATKFIMVYEGDCEGPFTLDRAQISEVRFMPVTEIATSVRETPENFTKTFREVLAFFLSTRRS